MAVQRSGILSSAHDENNGIFNLEVVVRTKIPCSHYAYWKTQNDLWYFPASDWCCPGTYIVEALNDEFPSSFILSHCIWPYESGEVIVQNYNVLLTLSHLQDFADGIIIVQNEQLSSICKSLLGIQRPSFDNMNEVAAQALTCILLPSHWRPTHQSSPKCDNDKKKDLTPSHGPPHNWVLPKLLQAVCAHPGYRMLTLCFTPQVSQVWFFPLKILPASLWISPWAMLLWNSCGFHFVCSIWPSRCGVGLDLHLNFYWAC